MHAPRWTGTGLGGLGQQAWLRFQVCVLRGDTHLFGGLVFGCARWWVRLEVRVTIVSLGVCGLHPDGRGRWTPSQRGRAASYVIVVGGMDGGGEEVNSCFSTIVARKIGEVVGSQLARLWGWWLAR